MTGSRRHLIAALAMASFLATGCGNSEATTADSNPPPGQSANGEPAGIRLISAVEGADVQNEPPQDLVILDVRTPEEFTEGHLDGAVMIDFYRDDFADQLALLDPDVPYLLYCRSGNRSGQTTALMEQLGFADVAEIDGGILSWGEAGLPVVTE